MIKTITLTFGKFGGNRFKKLIQFFCFFLLLFQLVFLQCFETQKSTCTGKPALIVIPTKQSFLTNLFVIIFSRKLTFFIVFHATNIKRITKQNKTHVDFAKAKKWFLPLNHFLVLTINEIENRDHQSTGDWQRRKTMLTFLALGFPPNFTWK